MDVRGTDAVRAGAAQLDARRSSDELVGRPSIVGFVVYGALFAATMYVVMAILWARASAPMSYVYAGIFGVGGSALAVLMAREFRGVATAHFAAADRHEFLARLDAEARRSGLVLDPPAGSMPTLPPAAQVVPKSATHRGTWWVVRVTFEGDLAVLTGPRYLVKHFVRRVS